MEDYDIWRFVTWFDDGAGDTTGQTKRDLRIPRPFKVEDSRREYQSEREKKKKQSAK